MIYDVIASWIFAVQKLMEEKHFGEKFWEKIFGEKNFGGKKNLGENKFHRDHFSRLRETCNQRFVDNNYSNIY